MNAPPKLRTPLLPVSIAKAVGQDWRKVGSHYGSLLGPEHDIRIVSTGKHYRIGDLTYLALCAGSEPTPEGWLGISEDGEPIEEDTTDHTEAMRLTGAFGR